MKTFIKTNCLFAAFLLVSALLIFGVANGCATKLTLSPAQPAVTNLDGTITPPIPAVTTNVPNTTVIKGTEAVKAAAPFIPSPWGNVLNAVAVAVAGITTLIAKNQNTQKKDIASATKTIIEGVEIGGAAAQAVKDAIAEKALAAGNADTVHALVQEHTAKPAA
jgi:hypothetical protein